MQTPAKAGTGPDQDGKLRSVRTITIGQYAINFLIKWLNDSTTTPTKGEKDAKE